MISLRHCDIRILVLNPLSPSNREILDVDVKDDSIAIDVFAEDGRRTHQYTFPKNH